MLELRTLAPILLSAVLIVGCSGGESQVVDTFLTAVQGGDEEMAKAVSMAEWTGKVESWEIVELGPSSSEAFQLAELESEFSKIMSDRKVEQQKNDYYRQDHKEQLAEYDARRKEDPEYAFAGEMAEFQKEWEERQTLKAKLDRAAADVQKQIDHLKDCARLSLSTDVGDSFEGDVSGRDLTIRVNDGSADKLYTFTVRRFNLADAARNLRPIARWVITDIGERES